MSIELSLCMIVKNEEERLRECLDSVIDIFDEINIVDTGSTDRTVEIAKEYTDRVYHFDWINDFSAARNFSFSKATREYIMWLDADDIILESDREKIKELKNNLSKDIDYVLMSYNYKQDEKGNPLIIQIRERIVKRSKGFRWEGAIHETIKIPAENTLFREDIYITHKKTSSDYKSTLERNMDILKSVIEGGKGRKKDIAYYAIILAKTGRYDEALKYFEELFELNKNKFDFSVEVDAYMAAFAIYCDIGEYEKAYRLLAENEKYFMDKSEYYCALGDFYSQILKDEKTAITKYKKALKCKGRNVGGGEFVFRYEEYYYYIPYIKLGNSYLSLKKYNEALNYYNKALGYSHGNIDEIKSVIANIEDIMRRGE